MAPNIRDARHLLTSPVKSCEQSSEEINTAFRYRRQWTGCRAFFFLTGCICRRPPLLRHVSPTDKERRMGKRDDVGKQRRLIGGCTHSTLGMKTAEWSCASAHPRISCEGFPVMKPLPKTTSCRARILAKRQALSVLSSLWTSNGHFSHELGFRVPVHHDRSRRTDRPQQIIQV